MPNRRSTRGGTKKFYCPFCETRLWRLGTTKYHLFYQDAAEVRRNTGISAKKAKLFINQNTTYLDPNKWIEGFHCSHDGNLWLIVSVDKDSYQYKLAKEEDWLRTNKTIDPRISNPSVSEFTLRMSRKPR